MTAILGSDGSVTLDAAHNGTLLNSFTFTASTVTTNVTQFSDSNLQRFRGGLQLLAGSATGTPDDTTGAGPGANAGAVAGATTTFLLATAKSWAFTALLSNVTASSDTIGGAASVTFDFINGDSDTLTETWT